MSALPQPKNSKMYSLLLPIIIGAVTGGGGSAAVNYKIYERITKVETKLESVERERDDYKKQLGDILKEVKDGQIYLRDTVMPALNDLKTDVAVIKSNR